jgi:hypothetical protein
MGAPPGPDGGRGVSASALQLIGAGCFGLLVGWYVYYVNRHRRGDVQLTDVGALVGVIGGGAVLTLFPEQTDLFGAYGVGLAIGFFGYFSFLLYLRRKAKFPWAWFLDGRRPKLEADQIGLEPGEHAPMEGGGGVPRG